MLQANSSAFGMALELLRSPYELAEVKLGYSGEVSSQIPAEFREERLKVHLAVSEHLPTPNSNKDEVKGLSLQRCMFAINHVNNFPSFILDQDKAFKRDCSLLLRWKIPLDM